MTHASAAWLPTAWLLAIGIALLALAALRDVAARTVPNSIPALLAADGVLLRIAAHSAVAGIVASGIVFAAAAACWRRGWLGGGDVKLLAASVLLLPPYHVPGYVAAVSLAGGVLALAYLLLASVVTAPSGPRPELLLRRLCRAERWRIARRAGIPYASAIAAGAVYALLIG